MEEKYEIAKDSINELYISTRKKFIRQKSDGTYSHSDGFKSKMVLNDRMIYNHLSDKETIGIFCPIGYTKFITLDIDCHGYSEGFRREIVLMLKDEIVNFNIPKESLYTSISGNKGYHLTIFLDDVTTVDNVVKFYEFILESTNLSSTMVELYPSNSNGLKLPLGTHQLTKRKCWFVDNCFNEIEDITYLSNVERFSRDEFQKLVSQISMSNDVKKKMNVIYNEFSDNKIPMLPIANVLTLERVGLTEPSTRNYSCLQLAIMYNTIGMSKSEAVDRLNDWIENQSTKYFKTSIDRCKYENEKIITWVYKGNVRFISKENKVVKFYKKEIDVISSIKDKKQRHLLFVLTAHFKRYYNGESDTFYMSYSQITSHTKIKNSSTIKSTLIKLEEGGFIDIVRKSEYNNDKNMYETNIYKLNFDIISSGRSAMSINDYSMGYMCDTTTLNTLMIL